MPSRLPISLAHLKAGNNSEKLKKKKNQAKIRQFFMQIKKTYRKYLQKFGRHYLKQGNNFYEQRKQ